MQVNRKLQITLSSLVLVISILYVITIFLKNRKPEFIKLIPSPSKKMPISLALSGYSLPTKKIEHNKLVYYCWTTYASRNYKIPIMQIKYFFRYTTSNSYTLYLNIISKVNFKIDTDLLKKQKMNYQINIKNSRTKVFSTGKYNVKLHVNLPPCGDIPTPRR